MAAAAHNGAARFAPGDFRHNARVAVAVIPAMSVMVGFGGGMVAGVCVVGAMAAYLLDAMRQREGSLAAVWLTLAAVNLFLITSSSIDHGSRPLLLCLMALGLCSGVLFVAGCWATLQFRWVQMQYPPVVMALERMVLAGSVTVGGPMIAWGAVAAIGAASAPYYFAFIVSCLYLLLAVPMPSSFHSKDFGKGGGQASKSPQDFAVLGRLETACCAATTIYLPVATYAAVHWHELGNLHHIWGMLLLGASPALAVLAAPGGLWWLSLAHKQSEFLRWTLALCALAALVAGIEGCIIFTAFREYILLHPPWDWVLVTAAMYGHGAVVLLHFSGALRSQLTYSVTMACLLLCCAAACIAVGIPSSIIPAPLVSAVGLGLYYRTHSMREYAIFLLGACIAGLWFVGHHFWFLDISWDGHWDVRTTCMLLMIYIAPTILLPGLLISRILPLLSGGTLVLHAAMLSFAEIVLFSGNNDTAGNMYPGYAIIGTSMVGILMAVHLVESQRIPRWSSLAAQLLYAAKIMVLVLPQPLQALHAVLLASAAFAPVVLHPSKPGALRQTRMLPSVAIAHFGSIIFLTWECRHTIFSSLGELLGNPPGEGLALGALLVVLALTLYPLAGLLSTTAVSARQGIILLLATGMLLMALRPPLPQSAACHPHHHHHKHARWMCLQLFNRSDGVAREADDIAIYGMGIGRKEHWPLWLLVLAMIAGLAASAQQRSLRSYGLSGRIFLGFVAGGAVGGYIALELFPSQKILQLLLMSTCLLVSCAVVLVGLPASKTPVLLHTILLLWAALLPAALLLERQSPLPEMHLQRLFADTVAAVEDERRMFRFVSLLLTYAVQSTLLAFCFKLKISRGLDRPLTGSSQSPIKNSVQLGFASKLGGFLGSCWTSSGTSMGAYHRAAAKAGSGYHGLRMEGLGWLPTAGNLITVLCFMLCVTLEMVWFKGGELVLLPLCSLLLLLSQDRLIFPQLNHRRRYFPPILAATSHLALTSCNEVMQIAHLHADATGQSPFVASAVQFCALLAALPNHIILLIYLWNFAQQSLSVLLIAAPLNLLALAITSIRSTRILSTLGILAAVVQWLAMRKTRRAGMRMI